MPSEFGFSFQENCSSNQDHLHSSRRENRCILSEFRKVLFQLLATLGRTMDIHHLKFIISFGHEIRYTADAIYNSQEKNSAQWTMNLLAVLLNAECQVICWKVKNFNNMQTANNKQSNHLHSFVHSERWEKTSPQMDINKKWFAWIELSEERKMD